MTVNERKAPPFLMTISAEGAAIQMNGNEYKIDWEIRNLIKALVLERDDLKKEIQALAKAAADEYLKRNF